MRPLLSACVCVCVSDSVIKNQVCVVATSSLASLPHSISRRSARCSPHFVGGLKTNSRKLNSSVKNTGLPITCTTPGTLRGVLESPATQLGLTTLFLDSWKKKSGGGEFLSFQNALLLVWEMATSLVGEPHCNEQSKRDTCSPDSLASNINPRT